MAHCASKMICLLTNYQLGNFIANFIVLFIVSKITPNFILVVLLWAAVASVIEVVIFEKLQI